MNGAANHYGGSIDLARERDFVLGAMTVQPSASAIVVHGATHRVEPRVMQTLVALAQANESVVTRDELMARCWHGVVVGEDAVTRAVGQVRRLARLAPDAFTVETIPKIGYRLIRRAATMQGAPGPPQLDVRAPRPGAAKLAVPIALPALAVLVVVASVFAFRALSDLPMPIDEVAEVGDRIGTENAVAHDRYLRATGLLDAGGRDNALRAEQLLREALELDPAFHSAKETLIVALLNVAAFVPERASGAYAEIADRLESETVDTPLAWRGHVMRGFQHVFAGDWVAADRSLVKARAAAPASAQGVLDSLETFLYGNVGRISDSFELVMRQARSQPLSRDSSRAAQQWLDRLGRHAEAEAEYVRSRDLPGDRSSIELAAVLRALGARDPAIIEERYRRYLETDWAREGDRALFAVRDAPQAALGVLRRQIDDWQLPGTMPPFLAAAWASYFGDQDLAIDGLRASASAGFGVTGLLWDPIFAETRRSTAFKELLRDFGYVDYWRTVGAWGDFCEPRGKDGFECR